MSGKKVKLKSVGKKGQIEKCPQKRSSPLLGPVTQSSGAPLGSVIFRYTSMPPPPPPTCTPFPQTTQLFYKYHNHYFNYINYKVFMKTFHRRYWILKNIHGILQAKSNCLLFVHGSLKFNLITHQLKVYTEDGKA